MKQFLLMLLVLLNVGFCQAQSQKTKPPKTTSTKPTGQTPPTAPPKPTQPEQMEKKKGSKPNGTKGTLGKPKPLPSLGVEKEQSILHKKDSIKN